MSNPNGYRLKVRRFSPWAILGALRTARELSEITNDTLPRAMTPSERAALLHSGVIFGVPVSKHDRFVPVRLPDGWAKTPTDNPSVTHLVDTNGYVRATLSTTTHSAHTEVHRRYRVSWTETEADGVTTYCGVVKDNASGESKHITLPESTDDPAGNPSEGPFSDNRDMAINLVTVRAESWLSHNFWGWENRAAYWDE